ncbi:hypothetical protein AB1Y20_012296 [Prymnesium parvum]|uniref:Uncharacterized protein n=1 Tax=Prymnesium parvum TaxID=97485 RepID=A0AB34IRM8_PRYPA
MLTTEPESLHLAQRLRARLHTQCAEARADDSIRWLAPPRVPVEPHTSELLASLRARVIREHASEAWGAPPREPSDWRGPVEQFAEEAEEEEKEEKEEGGVGRRRRRRTRG